MSIETVFIVGSRVVVCMLVSFACYAAVYLILSTFLWNWLAMLMAMAVQLTYHCTGASIAVAEYTEVGVTKLIGGLRGLRAKLGV